MRTRCPVCSTVFRVTSEQLRLKAGKVRCGHCQAIFNAFDELLDEAPVVDEAATALAVESAAVLPEPLSAPTTIAAEVPEGLESFEGALPPKAEPEAEFEFEDDTAPQVVVEEAPITYPDALRDIEVPVGIEENSPIQPEPEETSFAEPPIPMESRLSETPEELTLAAREAGLVAVRELSDAPGYNRWAAGTLAGNGLGEFEGDSANRAIWPFVLVALLFFVVLSGQLLYYFRTDVVQRWPSSLGLFELAAVDVPLPRNSELVAIETSDLQSDNARGLFVLQATLRNRASYAQAWPALELTLTDTNDTVVSRRVVMAAEYLPPATDPAAFPANGETAIKLWVEAKEIGAAGYRLYIFFP